MTRSSKWAGVVLAASTLLACGGDDEDGTLGERGNVWFSYARSCFYGCPLEQPLLTGSRETIDLSEAGDAQGVTARSLDGEIAEFALRRECVCERRDDEGGEVLIAVDASCESAYRKRCDNRIEVLAVAEGDVELELLRADASVLDRVQVSVRDAATAEITATYPDRLGSFPATELDLAVGETAQLEVVLYDSRDRVLLATEGLLWRVDSDIAELSAFLTASGPEVHTGTEASLEALAAGEAELIIEAPGLSSRWPLHIQD